MRIRSLRLSDYSPITSLHIDDLGNTVIIAGANGSGKTRLKDAIVATVQGNPIMDITLEATRPEEESEKYFGAETIELKKGEQSAVLQQYISSRRYGAGRYVGSLVQIDSTRSAQPLKYAPVNWLGGDPDDAEAPSTFYFGAFSGRWQDFVNYIHQKSAARDKKLAELVKSNPEMTGEEIAKKVPDPFLKYKKIFSEILPGKTLLDIEPAAPREFRYTDHNGQELPFTSLSSGEQEVVKVLFDVARKEIRHSIIVVDEPELHLHPTLAFKLVETLKSVGGYTNQMLLFTHSSDLISTYYSTGDVYFIDSDDKNHNQAHRLSDLGDEHKDIATLVGQNLGLFAVGKKLVFVEGRSSSIDRLTYQKIAQSVDSEIKIIPAGSVLNIMALRSIEEQIRASIFGIELYMIRDRDGLSDAQVDQLERNGRFRCLKRRHIENYFLDAQLLSEVSSYFYTKRNHTETDISNQMFEIAESALNFNVYQNTREHLHVNFFLGAPQVRGIESLSADEMRTNLVEAIESNVVDLGSALKPANISKWIESEESRLRQALEDGSWIKEFRGKHIFGIVCGKVLREDPLRVRQAYIDIGLKNGSPALSELRELFDYTE